MLATSYLKSLVLRLLSYHYVTVAVIGTEGEQQLDMVMGANDTDGESSVCLVSETCQQCNIYVFDIS